MPKPSCENCKHWKPIGDDVFGECKRYPPQIVVFANLKVSEWPKVHPSESCGEFEPTAENQIAILRNPNDRIRKAKEAKNN